MRFSERLYALADRDKFASSWIRASRTTASLTAVVVTIQNDLEGRIIILTNAALYAVPGAAQTVGGRYFLMVPPGGNPGAPYYLKRSIGTLGTGGIADALDWQGEVLVPPQWSIEAAAAFGAAAAANIVDLSLFGYSIPIGTLTPT